jgi:uncharacterized protein
VNPLSSSRPALFQSPGGSRSATALFSVLLLACACVANAAEVIPPAPKQYFNDYAHVVSAGTAARLNKSLEDFERESSSQILVVIYQKMESNSSIEDYTVRVAQSWKAGQKGRNNGAVLFVFVQDRKMYLQVGYGLEAVLPDAIAKQIIDNEIRPQFRNADYDGGLTAGVNAILAAAKGEYKGTGGTVADRNQQHSQKVIGAIIFLIIFSLVVLWFISGLYRGMRGMIYGRRGYSTWGGWGGGWTGGGGGGGWSSGGGGGGFSGGGGSFGGGGAGGSW